jgi:hypothetical protein
MNYLLESLKFSYKSGDTSLMTLAGFYILRNKKGKDVKNF